MFSKFDISLLVPGMQVDPSALEARSLGGSESAGIYMARALAAEGARVNVFCNTQDSARDELNVRYIPASTWAPFVKTAPHDVCIAQRVPEAFAQRTNARLNILWCHDLALARQQPTFKSALWNIDRVMVLSDYMRQQYHTVLGLDPETLWVTRNGVDLELFRSVAKAGVTRDRKKLIFAARPERGLDLLLREVMPRLLKRDPEFRLYLAGYDHRPSEWAAFYSECDALAARYGDRVVRIPNLPKRVLYWHYLSASVYVYPTPSAALPAFREVSCISLMECQAAGLPVVTSRLGALPETLAPNAGTLLESKPEDPGWPAAYADHFTDAVLRYATHDEAWHGAHQAGLERAQQLDWRSVARDWLNRFEGLIRAESRDVCRLSLHFTRASDMIARELLQNLDGERLDQMMVAHPAVQHRTSNINNESGSADEKRLAIAGAWLDEVAGRGAQTLVVTTCPDALATSLAERCKNSRIVALGYGISLACAGENAARRGVQDRIDFGEWSFEDMKDRAVDHVLVEESLECAREPWTLLQAVEKRLRPGGSVLLLARFGAWSPNSERPPILWQFDEHDIRDMLASKPNLSIDVLHGGDNLEGTEPYGWWVIRYDADHSLIGEIDMERHLWLQRPRQSLSAALIAGAEAEDTLHWTLKSLHRVSDEIVIADCGMSEEARRIADQYGVRLISGLDPRVAGFDQARNCVLAACRCDWCLWIDTDEKLIGPVEKYLRENSFHGYAIRQHHFACDMDVAPDLPTRLFRRREHKGRTARFWGVVHEHPELVMNEGIGPSLVLSDVHVAHVGYLIEATRRKRFVRNWPLLKLDQEKYPDRLLQKYFVMRDNVQMVRYRALQNGGAVDWEMQAKCRETIDLYRRYFLAPPNYMTSAALEYYSEALTFLGEGFEAAFQVEADKSEAKPNGARRCRFASVEDLCSELQRQAGEKAARFDSPWW